ncbi:Acetyltransferase (GNAT) family protein [Amycolatopsis pretoriensis]|uniref:Acetyltransferase (GNAT) family protein n=1 Tax=Amycolatopsis pretoriensis TaxID=218821 RepID=A0A1H5RIL2_9PSEU|nr:GNAT family N-acetyltransferase [Amycolatopsis pretoriensis]SEF38176.1 Acetyltransferase (GNAT) family protein [Amycolatopsis pretoriensis]
MRAADAPRLAGLLAQLGYPSDPATVTRRLAGILDSATRQVFVAADGARIDGYAGVERRPALLHQDEHAELTGLVVDAAARRSGLGRTLVRAAEQWAARHGLPAIVVRSNVVRPESHPFYEDLGYLRTSTSHSYFKDLTAAAGQRRWAAGP